MSLEEKHKGREQTFKLRSLSASPIPIGYTPGIYRKEPEANVGRVCRVKLKSPGLRCRIIGWTDVEFISDIIITCMRA